MKKLKRLMALVVFVIMTFSVLSVQMFAEAGGKLFDFSITCPGNYNVWVSPSRVAKTIDTITGAPVGHTWFCVYRLRNRQCGWTKVKDSKGNWQSVREWSDTIAVRTIAIPFWSNSSNAKTARGATEFVQVAIVAPKGHELSAISPANQPTQKKWNIGFSAGGDSNGAASLGVTASTEIEVNQLEFCSNIKGDRTAAYFKYNYKPDRTVKASNSKNTYVIGSSTQVCMAALNSVGDTSYSSITVAVIGTYALVLNEKIQSSLFIYSSMNTLYTWNLYENGQYTYHYVAP